MRRWRLDISDDKAETMNTLFNQIREHGDDFLNRDYFLSVERTEILNMMDWFQEAYDRRKAIEVVKQKWS